MSEWDLEWNSSYLSMLVLLHLNSCFTFFDTVNTGPTKSPTTCSDLPALTNGMILYNMGTASLRPVDTVATCTCDTGYTLNGGSTRTCGSDGVWSGLAPTCQCKLVQCTLMHLQSPTYSISCLRLRGNHQICN